MQGLSGPAHSPREDGFEAESAGKLAEAQGSETPAQIGTREVGVTSASLAVVPYDLDAGSDTPLREVDLRNGNKARALRQRAALSEPRVVEDEEGNVHRTQKTSLLIPEEKRCKAITVHGVRCRVGKMRGMEVCVFHAHHALSDDALASIADEETKPRLSPRKALKAVVALKGQQLAEAAVEGALSADGANRTRAVLALVDAVDPLQTEEQTITLSREGAATATWSQMKAIFNP